MGLDSESDVPDEYFCENCRPELHQKAMLFVSSLFYLFLVSSIYPDTGTQSAENAQVANHQPPIIPPMALRVIHALSLQQSHSNKPRSGETQ